MCAKRGSRLYMMPICQCRADALEHRGEAVQGNERGGAAGIVPALERGGDRVMIGLEDRRVRAPFCAASLKPTLPGIGVSSLISGIEVSEPGVRLQSMTSRE